MSETAKITAKNQITLPAEVRRSLGVTAGDNVDFVAKGAGVFELRARKETLADLRGIVRLPHKVTVEELDRWIDDARNAGYEEEGG